MKKLIKIISFLLVIATAVPALSLNISFDAAVTNDRIREKQNEISALQSLLKEQSKNSDSARKKIAEIQNDIEQTEERKVELIARITDLEETILSTEELIRTYEELIQLKEEEISETEKELSAEEASLIEFLRYDYESGSSSLKTIEFLLDSASLSDFLSNIQYIGTLMDYQEHLMQSIENTGVKYEGQKYDLDTTKTEKEEYAKQMNAELNEATALREQLMEYIYKLEASELEYEAVLQSSESAEKELTSQIEAAQAEEAELIKEEKERLRREEEERKRREEEERKKREAEELARKLKESQQASEREKAALAEASAAAYGSDGYLWPIPIDSTIHFWITGWFGYEPNPLRAGIRFHKAYDIGAASGTPILAARAGKVITAKYSSSYGNYVVILHSDGWSTLYAHASKLLVSVGQKVERGDVIAKVGTTGDSTGNHLHFEIILPNGKTREDPWDYFEKLSKLHINDSPRYDKYNNPRKKYYTP